MMQNNNNPFQGNPNLGQIQIQQQQQQQMGMGMGVINPNNGNVTIPNRPPQFMNLQPSQFVQMQNAMMMMRPSGQGQGQFFGPQNPNGPNAVAMNCSQPGGVGGGQFFGVNPMNMSNPQNFMVPNGQFHNPMNAMALPNGGQFCMQNPNQNMLQFVQMQMQMPNFAQVVPGNLQMFQNQVALGMLPQNPNFPGNQLVGMQQSSGFVQNGNQEQQKLISSTTNQSSSTGPQLKVNSSMQQTFGSVQSQQDQSFGPPGFTKPQPQQDQSFGPPGFTKPQPQQDQSFGPPGFTKPQGNLGNSNGVNNVNMKGNISHSKNFTRYPKNDASQRGFKPQFHNKQNGQGKNRFNHQHGNKGCNNDGSTKSDDAQRVERKPLPLNYTEQEIQQWREARKKNFPTKANVEKMVGEKQTLQEVADRDAKLRRQQLKDILAKQAELGCEVAEIPQSYLLDSEQGPGNEGNKKEWGKKGRFKNKFNKRGRSHQAERFTKKQNSGNHDPSDVNNDENTMKQQHQNRGPTTRPAMIKKEPTLLQKLLAADLSRDKSHLLQVFRFMVANSFFKDWPETPLRFPSVIIKETGAEGTYPVDNSIFDDDENDDALADDNVEPNAQAREGEKVSRAEQGHGGKTILAPEEEEGEIID